jgi:hypothetical protein
VRGMGNPHPTQTAWQSSHSSAVIAAVAVGVWSVQQVKSDSEHSSSNTAVRVTGVTLID